MATYKTPDVYIKEISLFPPSVAEVETAVPAFIGYTEMAKELAPGDLKNVPTKVDSLLEYEALFGGPPPVDVKEIILDENNTVAEKTLNSTFYMYDSLRLFFRNGGGKCYIISVGSYKDTPDKGHFETGLEKLKKKDEPTIILYPDAVLLEANMYSIHKLALDQCNTLQDRVAVFDLLESKNGDASFDWEKGKDEFRNSVGINYLKYGAAYTPWLKTNLGLTIGYRDITGKIMRGGNTISLDALTTDTDVKNTVTDLNNAVADFNQIESDVKSLQGTEKTLKAKYVTLVDAFKTTPGESSFKALFTFIYDIVDKIDEWAGKANVLKGSKLIADIQAQITDSLKATMEKLIAYDKSADDELTPTFDLYRTYDPVEDASWGDIFTETNTVAEIDIYGTGSTDTEKMQTAEPSVSLVFQQVNAAVAQIQSSAATYEDTFETNLYDTHPVYKTNEWKDMEGRRVVITPSSSRLSQYQQLQQLPHGGSPSSAYGSSYHRQAPPATCTCAASPSTNSLISPENDNHNNHDSSPHQTKSVMCKYCTTSRLHDLEVPASHSSGTISSHHRRPAAVS